MYFPREFKDERIAKLKRQLEFAANRPITDIIGDRIRPIVSHFYLSLELLKGGCRR